jgi:hypothetical protein
MNYAERLLEVVSEIWIGISEAPVGFTILGVATFLGGFAVAFWYYRREVRILRSMGTVLDQRVKSQQQEAAKLAALLRPRTGEAFFAIYKAPNHTVELPFVASQVAVRGEYRQLLDLGMIKIEKSAPGRTTLSSTQEALNLVKSIKEKR